MAKRITKQQTAKIWALAREIGLDREALYQLVPGGSISHLTRMEASVLIDSLVKLSLAQRLDADHASDRDPRGTGVTHKQQHFIHFLLGRLGWLHDPDHVRNFLHKYFHVDSVQAIRTRKQAGSVIEALKAMVKRKAGRGSAANAN